MSGTLLMTENETVELISLVLSIISQLADSSVF